MGICVPQKVKEQTKKIKSEKKIKIKVEWMGEPGRVEGRKRFYSKVLINKQHEVCPCKEVALVKSSQVCITMG